MSDLKFKAVFELSYNQLIDYLHELETRVTNAENGARIFKEEAQLARVELLQWRAVAGQAEDKSVLCLTDVERHLEMIIRLMDAIPGTATAWHEYDVLLRLVVRFMADMLKNFRETYLGEQPEPVYTGGFDDIPF